MRRKWILITVAVLIQAVLLVGCSKTKTPEITSIEQLNDKAYSVGVGEGAAGMCAVGFAPCCLSIYKISCQSS